MAGILTRLSRRDVNDEALQAWLKGQLGALPAGARLLDAGAGELRNKKHCQHLKYVSQDFCQFTGTEDIAKNEGILSDKTWDTSRVDIVSDITEIPQPDASFDAVLCSEVLEHVPEPTHALDEFSRLLKPGGTLIITAPFMSLVHMAPYHFCSGFSRYWYEHHLGLRGFTVKELTPNGDWYSYLHQELRRLGGLERTKNNVAWPIGYLVGALGVAYLSLRPQLKAADVACFGWLCVATKNQGAEGHR